MNKRKGFEEFIHQNLRVMIYWDIQSDSTIYLSHTSIYTGLR